MFVRLVGLHWSRLRDGARLLAPPVLPVRPAAEVELARAILKELVEIHSVHVNGSTAAAKAVAARLLAAGFPPADVQVLAPVDHPTKGNVVLRLHGRGLGEPVLFIGHLDVVEAKREDWTYDPFRLTEKDGWLYGRGTLDMLGQDTAMLVSMLRMRHEGFIPDRDVVVALTADEEAGGDANGVEWLLRDHRDLVAAGVVINPDAGEAARKGDHRLYLGMQTSEKKGLTFEIELTDKGGHSFAPDAAEPDLSASRRISRASPTTAFRFTLPTRRASTSSAAPRSSADRLRPTCSPSPAHRRIRLRSIGCRRRPRRTSSSARRAPRR